MCTFETRKLSNEEAQKLIEKIEDSLTSEIDAKEEKNDKINACLDIITKPVEDYDGFDDLFDCKTDEAEQ